MQLKVDDVHQKLTLVLETAKRACDEMGPADDVIHGKGVAFPRTITIVPIFDTNAYTTRWTMNTAIPCRRNCERTKNITLRAGKGKGVSSVRVVHERRCCILKPVGLRDTAGFSNLKKLLG
ncbi:hypothetical protein E2C01_002375 [Portunus trituberculatus]|uniref:Uncharacterized protein n=1 Tax=Portunus trituberculatus TaxID=210409 RepID=A0A5B7CKT9_PORTR|nr:hypothetical protein [Portunus trituberculatus]